MNDQLPLEEAFGGLESVKQHFPVQALSDETVNHMNQLEHNRDYDELEKFCEDLDEKDQALYDAVETDQYFKWMSEFEALAIPEIGFPLDMDVDYSVVDKMYDEGVSPKGAVADYSYRKLFG